MLWWCCSWDLSQPPRDNSPALRLYRHSQSVTGVAQITDERLVSGSMDGTVRARVLEGCWKGVEGVRVLKPDALRLEAEVHAEEGVGN